ncbi:MAG: STAS domain-containing protein [Akkermansiaceae bacterium]
MKKSADIFVGKFESFFWIRVNGRGTFQISPLIKEALEQEASSGWPDYVIDLEECPGMDSTFMGTLAGIGMRLQKLKEGRLSILGTDAKNRNSLEELGLDYLMEIEPEGRAWEGRLDEIRAGLNQFFGEEENSGEDHILESHENLCEADSSNQERFKTVLEVMGSNKFSPSSDKPD